MTIGDEIRLLRKKIYIKELEMDKISAQFFAEGGVCCPSCGEPGYSKLVHAQERREAWLKILLIKAIKKGL